MDEQSINWGDLLGTVVKTAGSVVSAKVDKPISNATQTQPTNQQNSAAGNAQSAAAATATPATASASPLKKYAPVLIGGGVLLVGVILFFALKSKK